MSQRTTVEKVRSILVDRKDYDGETNLQPFIDTAVILTDRVASKDSDSELSDAALALIEAWLAAHYYCTPDRPYQSRNQGKSGGSFQGQTGMHLESTYYGQTAMDLDFTGTLANINKGTRKAKAHWLGKAPSAQTDYEDRD